MNTSRNLPAILTNANKGALLSSFCFLVRPSVQAGRLNSTNIVGLWQKKTVQLKTTSMVDHNKNYETKVKTNANKGGG
jgi:hypothetical protein